MTRDHRYKQEDIGNAGEQRTAAYLEQFGKVSYGSKYRSTGTDGYPDLVLEVPIDYSLRRGQVFFACEVKSMKPISRSQGSNAKLYQDSWRAMSKWARGHANIPVLIVEMRVNEIKKRYLYFLIEPDLVDGKITNKPNNLTCNFSLWEIIEHGHLIKNGEIFSMMADKYVEKYEVETLEETE